MVEIAIGSWLRWKYSDFCWIKGGEIFGRGGRFLIFIVLVNHQFVLLVRDPKIVLSVWKNSQLSFCLLVLSEVIMLVFCFGLFLF